MKEEEKDRDIQKHVSPGRVESVGRNPLTCELGLRKSLGKSYSALHRESRGADPEKSRGDKGIAEVAV